VLIEWTTRPSKSPAMLHGLCAAVWDCPDCEDILFEAYERMTDGGIQLTPYSRKMLDWTTNVRFCLFGKNRWSVVS
jgi:hypothetical protein